MGRQNGGAAEATEKASEQGYWRHEGKVQGSRRMAQGSWGWEKLTINWPFALKGASKVFQNTAVIGAFIATIPIC
jgi:hypothetical protein